MNELFVQKMQALLFGSSTRCRISQLIGGALYPFAFSPFEIWPLAFVSLFFLLFALLKPRALSGFKLGFYWGIGCFLVGASWVYVSIHEFGFVPIAGAVLLTLLFAAYLALFKGLFGYLTQKLLSLTSSAMLIFIMPAFWILSEFLQSVVFNGFPWLLAGYSQIDSPLSAIATWLGVYGLSWFVLALTATSVLIISHKNKRPFILVITLLFGFIFTAYMGQQPAKQSDSKAIDIALVQPNIAQEIKWDRQHFSHIIDVLMAESEPLWGADLVIWPEGAIPAYAHQVPNITQELTQRAVNNNSHLIVGIPQYEVEKELSFVALKAYGKTPQSYFKQVLVPFGEYVPLQNWLRGLIDFLNLPMSNFSPAVNQQVPMAFENFSLIPAICYEIVYPSIIHQLSKQAEQLGKPQLIVTVSNDAWFGDSLGPYQHMQMARLRALELGLPLVRATNDGITAMVDARGNIIKQLPRYFQGSLRASLKIENISTPYRRIGFWGIGIILLVSCVFIVHPILKKQSIKNSTIN